MDLSRVVPFLFNFSMASYFIYAFLFPAATEFWVAKLGFAVLILEFFGIFLLFLLPAVVQRRQAQTANGSALQGVIQAHLAFILGSIMLAALAFSYILDALSLYAYFLFSTASKAVQIRFAPPDDFSVIRSIAYSVVFLVLGAWLAIFIADWAAIVFPESVAVLSAYFKQTGHGAKGLVVENPGFTAVWGFLYFVGMAAVSLKPDLLPIRQMTPAELAALKAKWGKK